MAGSDPVWQSLCTTMHCPFHPSTKPFQCCLILFAFVLFEIEMAWPTCCSHTRWCLRARGSRSSGGDGLICQLSSRWTQTPVGHHHQPISSVALLQSLTTYCPSLVCFQCCILLIEINIHNYHNSLSLLISEKCMICTSCSKFASSSFTFCLQSILKCWHSPGGVLSLMDLIPEGFSPWILLHRELLYHDQALPWGSSRPSMSF